MKWTSKGDARHRDHSAAEEVRRRQADAIRSNPDQAILHIMSMKAKEVSVVSVTFTDKRSE